MAHAEGWIELYGMLEAGQAPPPELLALCRANRNGIGETMLHWYAIEGAPDVLQQIVDLGHDLDTVNDHGATPLIDAARIGRWDNCGVLRRAGARVRHVDSCGFSYRALVSEAGDAVPAELRGDAYSLDDLLDLDGPEDVEVAFLRLTRRGLAVGAPGVGLDEATWARYAAGLPEEFAAAFDLRPAIAGEPEGWVLHVAVWRPEVRRLAHEAARHFGARVSWEFECPPE